VSLYCMDTHRRKNMTNQIYVLLADNTKGQLDVTSLGIDADASEWIGEQVEIVAKDENGNPIRVSGKLEEIL